MKKILSGSNKNLFGIFLGLGFLILMAILVKYNNEKSSTKDNMMTQLNMNNLSDTVEPNNPQGAPSGMSGGTADNYLSVSGVNTKIPQANMSLSTINPEELLPKDMNSEWASITPATNDLKNQNLLDPSQMIGINTVGSSLRNANLQLRSDPVIPKASNLGPWNQSTIDQDNMRRPFEIGTD